MVPLRGLRNLLACLVDKTALIFVVELYDSYVSNGESANSFPGFSPTNPTLRRAGRREPWERGWRKCLSPGLSTGHDPWSQQMHVIRGTYKSTCILGTGQ